MPSVYNRIAAAYAICDQLITAVDILPTRIPNHIRFRLTLTDDSHLHISEEWRRGTLGAYSYYWLDAHDALIQGWDNAPHYPRLSHHPLHTHIGSQSNRQPSASNNLAYVLAIIRSQFDTV